MFEIQYFLGGRKFLQPTENLITALRISWVSQAKLQLVSKHMAFSYKNCGIKLNTLNCIKFRYFPKSNTWNEINCKWVIVSL